MTLTLHLPTLTDLLWLGLIYLAMWLLPIVLFHKSPTAGSPTAGSPTAGIRERDERERVQAILDKYRES